MFTVDVNYDWATRPNPTRQEKTVMLIITILLKKEVRTRMAGKSLQGTETEKAGSPLEEFGTREMKERQWFIIIYKKNYGNHERIITESRGIKEKKKR